MIVKTDPENKKEFLMQVRENLENLVQIMKKKQLGERITKEDATKFLKNVKSVSGEPLICSKLNDICEVIMDWAITNKIQ